MKEMRRMGISTATTEEIWEAFHMPLQQFIRRRVPDDPTAEDLLQEVFLKIHQHIGGLKDARQLESWLYRLTRNIIIDYYRSQRRTLTLDAAQNLALPELRDLSRIGVDREERASRRQMRLIPSLGNLYISLPGLRGFWFKIGARCLEAGQYGCHQGCR